LLAQLLVKQGFLQCFLLFGKAMVVPAAAARTTR